MPGGGKGGGKGGSAGHASNAALQDDEDTMNRRKINFGKWAEGRRKKNPYPKSNMPPAKKM